MQYYSFLPNPENIKIKICDITPLHCLFSPKFVPFYHLVNTSQFTALQIGSSICLYISKTKLWPYPDGETGKNAPNETCIANGLKLATVQNDQEKMALWSLTRKLLAGRLADSESLRWGWGVLDLNKNLWRGSGWQMIE